MNVTVRVDVRAREFSVEIDGESKRFGIPQGFDVRTTDLKEVVAVASAIAEVDSEHWWELCHGYRKEPNQYRCSKYSLHYAGEREPLECYIHWECDAEGYERAHGIRGLDLGQDRLGGIIADQEMELFLYKIACTEEDAAKEGYVLDGRQFLRVVDDSTGALVQVRVPATWSKPPRWQAVPID